MAQIELPLFELPVVLLPGELLPLHIFEERYKAMVAHSMERDEPFGIVFTDEDSGAADVGCTAAVADVLERFDDGRLNIVVAGGSPFTVTERHERPEFPAGTVELIELEDEPEEQDPDASARARAAFDELAREAADDPDDVADPGEGDAYAIAARITLPPETKQKLLETRSEGERIRILARALEAVLQAVRRSQRLAETAQTNGHAPL
ncbi:MAG TPA: LON peptidase substrate-binding domain-containing protein [Solirubrobacterales bacterium]